MVGSEGGGKSESVRNAGAGGAEPPAGPRMAGPLFAGGMPKLRPVGSKMADKTPSTSFVMI